MNVTCRCKDAPCALSEKKYGIATYHNLSADSSANTRNTEGSSSEIPGTDTTQGAQSAEPTLTSVSKRFRAFVGKASANFSKENSDTAVLLNRIKKINEVREIKELLMFLSLCYGTKDHIMFYSSHFTDRFEVDADSACKFLVSPENILGKSVYKPLAINFGSRKSDTGVEWLISDIVIERHPEEDRKSFRKRATYIMSNFCNMYIIPVLLMPYLQKTKPDSVVYSICQDFRISCPTSDDLHDITDEQFAEELEDKKQSFVYFASCHKDNEHKFLLIPGDLILMGIFDRFYAESDKAILRLNISERILSEDHLEAVKRNKGAFKLMLQAAQMLPLYRHIILKNTNPLQNYSGRDSYRVNFLESAPYNLGATCAISMPSDGELRDSQQRQGSHEEKIEGCIFVHGISEVSELESEMRASGTKEIFPISHEAHTLENCVILSKVRSSVFEPFPGILPFQCYIAPGMRDYEPLVKSLKARGFSLANAATWDETCLPMSIEANPLSSSCSLEMLARYIRLMSLSCSNLLSGKYAVVSGALIQNNKTKVALSGNKFWKVEMFDSVASNIPQEIVAQDTIAMEDKLRTILYTEGNVSFWSAQSHCNIKGSELVGIISEKVTCFVCVQGYAQRERDQAPVTPDSALQLESLASATNTLVPVSQIGSRLGYPKQSAVSEAISADFSESNSDSTGKEAQQGSCVASQEVHDNAEAATKHADCSGMREKEEKSIGNSTEEPKADRDNKAPEQSSLPEDTDTSAVQVTQSPPVKKEPTLTLPQLPSAFSFDIASGNTPTYNFANSQRGDALQAKDSKVPPNNGMDQNAISRAAGLVLVPHPDSSIHHKQPKAEQTPDCAGMGLATKSATPAARSPKPKTVRAISSAARSSTAQPTSLHSQEEHSQQSEAKASSPGKWAAIRSSGVLSSAACKATFSTIALSIIAVLLYTLYFRGAHCVEYLQTCDKVFSVSLACTVCLIIFAIWAAHVHFCCNKLEKLDTSNSVPSRIHPVTSDLCTDMRGLASSRPRGPN